jgi:hypothetical protein
MIEPYYEDKLVKIYNCSTFIFKSDVVVLDPPGLLHYSNRFEAKVYYIFCGKESEFYQLQFPDKRRINCRWQFTVPDAKGRIHNTYSDTVLVVGDVLVPGVSCYRMRPISERYNRWERPLEFVMNLIAESEGDILDPFMGSGVVLVAAKKQGRKAIGFEIEESLCKVAAERCKEIE